MLGKRFLLTATGLVLGALLLVGCPESPTGGSNDNAANDNSAANENDNAGGGANTNENGGGGANVNDNESENDNESGNENDSGAGNDNTDGGANDNTDGGANDNAADNANDNAAGDTNDNAADNTNDNAADNTNDNAADNTNDNSAGNDNGGGGGGGSGNTNTNTNTNDNSSGEGTEQVGCPGFDEVVLTASPFAGSTAPDPLPSEPVTVLVGEAWGVVVGVGDLGNNTGSLFLLVTLDDNELNGNTGELLEATFIESATNFTILPLPSTEAGTFFVVATLFSDALDTECNNVAQVYNTTVTVTFEDSP